MPSSEGINVLKIFESFINKIPGNVAKSVEKEISTLRRLIVNQRQPHIMIIGRRGAGKSSLLNAMFGEKAAAVGSVTSETLKAKWYSLKTSKGTMNLLDTRGLGDLTHAKMPDVNKAVNNIENEIDKIVPDALLFLCKAKEVDARIVEDLENVKTVLGYIKKKHSYTPPIIGVVTQVDELDPLSDTEIPYKEKKKNIMLAVETLKNAFKTENIEVKGIIPTSAYGEFDTNNKVKFSRFWNVDKLVEYMTDNFPPEAKVQLVRMSSIHSAQERVCRMITHSTATLCSGVAVVPIPFADIFPITSLQIGLIISIGYTAGRSLTIENAREFLGAVGCNIGSAFVFRETARALVKIIPGYGSAISGGVAYAGTWAIGEAAIAYFIQGRKIDEVQQIMKNVFVNKKKDRSENSQ